MICDGVLYIMVAGAIGAALFSLDLIEKGKARSARRASIKLITLPGGLLQVGIKTCSL